MSRLEKLGKRKKQKGKGGGLGERMQTNILLFLVKFYIIIALSAVQWDTVNQQILASIKFGVSQNKVIWLLLNLASPRGLSMQCTIDVYVGGDKY